MTGAALLGAQDAAAAVRWDMGAQVGAMQRLTVGRDPGAPFPAIGPWGELHAHIALWPLVRLGPYLAHDISPVAASRQTTEAGIRIKVSPPLLSYPWRSWAFGGLGYARSYLPSHPPLGSAWPTYGYVGGAEGGIFDALLGVGVGARARGPWVFFAELAGRIGLGFAGTMYDRTQCLCLKDPYAGKDVFAASLGLGVSLED